MRLPWVNLPYVYGCITTGDDWLFIKLEDDVLFIDVKKYYLGQIEELLAAFQTIIERYKKLL